ncbi:MAG TPA: transcriptional repressor [Verrucomicrobiales bacterium]|nr:transcriptional repressor [Verrucomicrobiales bacterium]
MPRSPRSRAPSACSVPSADAEILVAGIIEKLRQRGLRRSKALEALLLAMANHHHPATLAELGESPDLRKRDQATIYRLVCKLEEAGVVRRRGLVGRSSHYELVVPGHHHDYLVCRHCGRVQQAPLHCELERVETELAARSGWNDLEHELEFFGTCPGCSGQR